MARRINMPGEPGPFGSARSPAYLLLGARNVSSDCFPRKGVLVLRQCHVLDRARLSQKAVS